VRYNHNSLSIVLFYTRPLDNIFRLTFTHNGLLSD